MSSTSRVVDVDLTLDSSPEPEPRPQHRQHPHAHQPSHARQHPLQPSVNHPHRASPNNANPTTPNRSRPHPAAHSALPLPSIHPSHVRQIVSTALAEDVKELLIELCRTSPALSGAVVRGLAPHSTWAQITIHDYQRRNRLGTHRLKTDQGASSSPGSSRPPAQKYHHGHPRTPHPNPNVKSEVDMLDLDSNDSQSDLDPGPSRLSTFSDRTIAGPSSSNYRASHHQSPTLSRPPPVHGDPALSVRIKPELRDSASSCQQCNEIIQPGTICHFHIGRKRIAKLGNRKIPLWNCCRKPPDATGCCQGDHIPEKRDSIDNGSTSNESKKPRLI